MHPAYFAVRAYMQELKHMPGCDLPGFADEVEPINYAINQLGKATLTLKEWVTSKLQGQPKFSTFAFTRMLFPKYDTEFKLVVAKIKYNKLHHELLGPYDYSMPLRPTPEVWSAIDMSFGQFLDQHGLSALTPILACTWETA